MKKVREPMLTAEEKATKVNKQEIKGTGKINNKWLINIGFNLDMI